MVLDNRMIEMSGNAEGFGYRSPTQMSSPMKSSGAWTSTPPPGPTAHPGISGSSTFISGLQSEGRNQAFNNGASPGHQVEQTVEHKAENSGLKQGVKQLAKRIFKPGDVAAGDTAVTDAAAADAGATAAPLLAPAAVAATGFALAQHFTGHPSQQQPGQSRQSWVNQNISTGQFAPQASQELFHQTHPYANGGVMAHPGR